MVRATISRSKDGQVLRLPKSVAFPERVEAVDVHRDGNRMIIAPFNCAWDDFFDQPGIDLGTRKQPPLTD